MTIKKPLRRIQISTARFLDIAGILLVYLLTVISAGLIKNPNPGNIFLLALFGFVALRIGYELTFNRGKVPVAASSFFERRKIAELLKKDAAAHNGKPYTVIDMGSGRGELTRCVATALPDAQVIGLELSKPAYWQAVFLQHVFGIRNLEYRHADFMSHDCSGADAVVMYLSDELTKQVGEKLRRELKPGAFVIANESPLPGAWPAPEIVAFRTPFPATLYVYKNVL